VSDSRALPPETPYGVCMVVAYDGSGFAGWQEQPDARTVQSVLSETVRTMSGCASLVRGCSRTDAGVHAEAQLAAFRAERRISKDGWIRGLNTRLPHDVAIKDAWFVAPNYDPRFDSTQKSYRYVIDVGRVRHPLLRSRVWFVGRSRCHPNMRRHPEDDAEKVLDMDAMRAAALALTGTHDFVAFQATGDPREKTTRTMHEVRLETGHAGDPRLVAIHVRGDAFLQHMVRIIAGTLLDVGRGKLSVQAVKDLLVPGADRGGAGETAPAHGLTLMDIQLGRMAMTDNPRFRP
jgi:tRNA pseudouridine38-40 synthase